ncbi:hypothetical protein B0H34DRAFT_297330 [Crassisporium funariophilum]|nr:hypothetical protein B0H34DRAFT_297330 [Crassisporium funariophilum]
MLDRRTMVFISSAGFSSVTLARCCHSIVSWRDIHRSNADNKLVSIPEVNLTSPAQGLLPGYAKHRLEGYVGDIVHFGASPCTLGILDPTRTRRGFYPCIWAKHGACTKVLRTARHKRSGPGVKMSWFWRHCLRHRQIHPTSVYCRQDRHEASQQEASVHPEPYHRWHSTRPAISEDELLGLAPKANPCTLSVMEYNSPLRLTIARNDPLHPSSYPWKYLRRDELM